MAKNANGISANDKLANSFVTLTANLQRLSASENLIVQGVLKDLELDIVQKLQNNPNMTDWRKARYNALLDQTKETIQANYSKISNQHNDFLTQVGSLAGEATSKIFAGVGIPLQSVIVTPEQWKVIAGNSMVNGAPSAAWWQKQSQNLQDAFVQQMRIGYASGESVDDLVKRVRGTATGKKNNYVINDKTYVYVEFQGGIMDTSTRAARTLVRTSVQQMASDAKLEMFKKNADILKGVMWLSTLDSRTTPLCRSRDGLLYDLDGQPIGHDNSFLSGPPAHWNCRSTLVPVTKSFEELGGTPGVTADYLEQINEGTRASMNGQVPAHLTFDSWFRSLPVDDQKAFLGPKYKIWKEAGLNFIDMVDPAGNPLTLEQLADAYGVKIEQSIQSGIPNVPKKMVSAIAVEQQAQILASKMAETEAQQKIADALQIISDMAISQDALTSNVYNFYKDELSDDDPVKNQDFLQAQISQEKKIKDKYENIGKEINKFLKDPDISGTDYNEAMEKMTALKQVDKSLVLPSQKMASYQSQLNNLKNVNAKITQEIKEDISKNPFIGDLQADYLQDLANKGEKAPIWDMSRYKSELDAYIHKMDMEASNKMVSLSNDPKIQLIDAKALVQAQANIQQGLQGSAWATSKEFDKVKDNLFEIEKQAQKALEPILAEPVYKNVINAMKLGDSSLILDSDILSQFQKIAQDWDVKAIEKIKSIEKSINIAEAKAWAIADKLTEGKSAYIKYLTYQNKLVDIQKELTETAIEAVKDIIGTHNLDGSILSIGSKNFDIADAQGLKDFKKYKSLHLSNYKKSILIGKKPAPIDKQIYDNLSEIEKQAFQDSLEKALNKKSAIPPISNAVPEVGELQMSQMEKIGDQKGSNPGGFYRDKRTGTEYYIKFPASEDIARNELLASKLYRAAGVDVPELTLLWDGDQVGIASKIQARLRQVSADELAKAIGSGNGYAVDAWLANWDVVGLNNDNMLLTNAGTAFRVDVGGSLRYRAQGGLKGNLFGDTVSELESLRDARINPKAAAIFEKLTQADLEAGVRKVLALDDEEIRRLVGQYGPRDAKTAQELSDILIARKNDLAKKFPHLAKPIDVPPIPDAGKFVGAAEVKAIENARINGYALPADTDKIEDQSILLWFEKNGAGDSFTGLRFKFTPTAQEQISKVIGDQLDRQLTENEKSLAENFESFKLKFKMQWNVNHNKAGLAINKSLIDQNWNELQEQYQNLLRDIGKYNQVSADKIKELYDIPMRDLKKSLFNEEGIFKPLGMVAEGKFYNLDMSQRKFEDFIIREAASVSESSLEFHKIPASFYWNKLENGYAIRTNDLLPSPSGGVWKHCYEAKTPEGIRIRIWPGESIGGRALENQIEILTPGVTQTAINNVMNLIEKELGIKVIAPTAIQQEEMYLRMIARHRGNWDILDAADAMKSSGSSPMEIRDYLKRELSTGQDITKLSAYNPYGVHEAFDTGYRRWYLPEVDTDPEWKKFTKNYVLFHENTNSRDFANTLDAILNSGGKFVPTTQKLRYGFPWGGMSPSADMDTGGADYFFTRIFGKKRVQHKQGFVFNSRLAARLDSIAYYGDSFGRTTGNYVRNNSRHGISELKENASNSTNELIFKNGLSLFDGLEYINCRDKELAESVLQTFAKHGWTTTWIDGRPIMDLVRIDGEKYK